MQLVEETQDWKVLKSTPRYNFWKLIMSSSVLICQVLLTEPHLQWL